MSREHSIESRLVSIREQLKEYGDVNIRNLELGQTKVKAAIMYCDGLTDREQIDLHVLKPLMTFSFDHQLISKELIQNTLLTTSEIIEVETQEEMLSKVLTGFTALLVDGIKEIILINALATKSRSIEEPISESLVRGPRAGFNENLSDNIALLRKQGENKDLCLLKLQVGERAKKDLYIAYIKGVANPDLVEEVRQRVAKIRIDNVLESGYIEQLIEDNYLSPFPQIQNTERPDRVTAALMEGKVAILLDGTPFVLIAPVTFSMLLQSPEDYYERWMAGTLLRIMRFFAAVMALFVPAIYISFISFHPGLIPTKLVISIIATRVGVPFSSLLEALIMETAIEILREAGLRLPKPIGPAMGIVGGLIIGEAAVQAGIVSPILVIVVALTAICSFSIPQYSAGISLRMLRFPAMFCAAAFGMYGVILYALLLGAHISRLQSFGVPYASPAAPYRLGDWKDFLMRAPLRMMKRRPKLLFSQDYRRKR